jgi:ectoine hydroxylase-related dioxygenase (phytanoyl-CoA dioxygenase family)
LRSLGLQTPAYALRPQLIWASNWMESAGAHSLRPLHQDWERLGGSLDSVVGWMPLTPVREGGFPLLVSPGSHRWGVLPHAVYRAGIQIADESAKRDVELKTIEADPGDLVLFSSLLVHSSGEGEADRLRMALSYRYNNLSDRSYIARGFPSGFKLTPVENPAPEDLPTAEDVAEVFGPA